MNEHGKTLYDYCRFMNNMKMRIGLEWLSDVKVESENSGFLVYFFPRGSKRQKNALFFIEAVGYSFDKDVTIP